MNQPAFVCPKCLIPFLECPCEPDTSDIPEAAPGWFDQARLVRPDAAAAPPSKTYWVDTGAASHEILVWDRQRIARRFRGGPWLPEPENIWYLATPYMGFAAPDGVSVEARLALAFEAATFNACVLMRADVMVYCPVAHGHAIAGALHGRLIDEQVWLAHGRLMMPYCRGLIRCRLPGWDRSSGVAAEARWFEDHGRPVVEMEPNEVPAGLTTRNGDVTF